MSKMMKKFVSLFVIGMIVLCGAVPAIAASNDASDFTLFAYNNLTMGGGSVIDGNAVVKNTFNELNQDTWVRNGFLYAKTAKPYDDSTDQEYIKQVNNRGYLARGPHEGKYIGAEPEVNIALKPFPTLPNRGALPKSRDVNITESGQYNSFNTSWNTTVSITTTSADQLIEIRTSKLSIVGDHLKIVGPGKVIFYVDEVRNGGGDATLNETGDSRNVMIYLSGKKNSTFSNMGGNFNLYVGGQNKDQTLTFCDGGPIIKGNIYTPGKVSINNGREIDGYVYAPNSDVTIDGNGIVRGKLVAKNMTIKNGAQVIGGAVTDADLTGGIVQNIVEKQKFHVKISAGEGGTITPSYDQGVEGGTVIPVKATADSGYQFVRYEGDQPDDKGNITVTKEINLKAIFEAVETPPPDGDYKNGLLGEYFDSHETSNDTAIRLKRIDPQISFNFGYAAPEGTDNQIGNENFSEKWTGFIKVPKTGEYTFKTLSDDGVKLTINGVLLINRWGLVNLDYTISQKIHLEAGQFYPITLEHQQMPLYAAVYLFWEAEGVPMGVVPANAFYVDKKVYDNFIKPVPMNGLKRNGTGLDQEFYSGAEGLNGDAGPVCEKTGMVNYEWGSGSPSEDIEDAFSARMTGYLEGKFTEEMILEFIVDDGIRVWVDDKPIINSWKQNSDAMLEGIFDMNVGQKHKLKIEYNDVGGGATCIMRWKSDSQQLQVIPLEYLYSNSKT